MVRVVAGPIAFAVPIVIAGELVNIVAASESIADIIGRAAHGDDDDDNDDDDDQAGDADAECAADTASAEAGLCGFDALILRVLLRLAAALLLLGDDGTDFGLLLGLLLLLLGLFLTIGVG